MEAIKQQYIKEIGVHTKSYNNILSRQIAFLQRFNIELADGCVAYCYDKSLVQDPNIDSIIKAVSQKTCRIIQLGLTLDYQQVDILLDGIMECTHLCKIEIQITTVHQNASLDWFKNVQENCQRFPNLIVCNVEIQNQRFYLNKETQFFLWYSTLNQVQFNNILPLYAQKIRNIDLHFTSETDDEHFPDLIQFLDTNASTLTKIQYTSSLKPLKHNILFNKITEINEKFNSLDFVTINLLQGFDFTILNMNEFLVRNQRIEYLKVNQIGLDKNNFVHITEKSFENTQYDSICNAISQIPRIQKVLIYGGSLNTYQFFSKQSLLPSKRLLIQTQVEPTLSNIINLAKNYYFKYEIQELYYRPRYTSHLESFNNYQRSIEIYLAMYVILQKRLQELVFHRIKNSFLDLAIDES